MILLSKYTDQYPVENGVYKTIFKPSGWKSMLSIKNQEPVLREYADGQVRFGNKFIPAENFLFEKL